MDTRHAAIAVAMLALGLATSLAWEATAPPLRAVTVFERYEQRPACRAATASRHALLALKPVVPARHAHSVRTVTIEDEALPAPVVLRVEGGRYGYEGLFGKVVHWEQWRQWCGWDGWCQFNINYYADALAPRGASPRHISLTARDGRGAVVGATQRALVEVPSAADARGRSFVGLDAGLQGGVLWAEVDPGPGGGPPVQVVFQVRPGGDGAGRAAETAFEVPRGAGPTRLRVPADGASYAGVFAFREEGEASTENKVELADSGNPAYRCPPP